MDKSDVLYRAFCDYRKWTEGNKECRYQRKELRQADSDKDWIKTKKYICSIDEDWVVEIENSLEFIVNAIQEERQFITSMGEVVPIEKVRKVSKASVEHLARHSNLITHVPEEEKADLVPEKIYMVEKLADYTVYENRFLYMLLCYLRDFIELRLNKITAMTSRFTGSYEADKKIESKLAKFQYQIRFYEERSDNPKPLFSANSDDLFDRIKSIQHTVLSLLNTPLMIEVSKAPMIKPPIVKTNPLKMNNNFKHALALYEFVSAYDKDGFTIEEQEKNFHPFPDVVSDEVSELMVLTSFLVFLYGNDLRADLKLRYEADEERRKEAEAKHLVEQIKRLKRRILESGMGTEEYMLLLEQRNRDLEKANTELVIAKQLIEQLNTQINDLKDKNQQLQKEIRRKEAEITALNEKYIHDLNEQQQAYEAQIEQMSEEHLEEIADLEQAHQQELEDLQAQHIEELDEQALSFENEKQQWQEELDLAEQAKEELVRRHQEELSELDQKRQEEKGSFEQTLEKQNSEALELEKKLAGLTEEKRLLSAQLKSELQQRGLTKDMDFTSKENFQELEKEYQAFTRFFQEQWKETKKKIRKDILWNSEPKKKNKEES